MVRSNARSEAPKQTPKAEKKENGLLKARHAAVDRLIAENLPRFEELYVEEAKARGLEYTPPLTEAQKAEAQMQAFIRDYPDLAEQMLSRQREVQNGAPASGIVIDGEGDDTPPTPDEAGQIAQG